jgi:RNA ligase (TIGR02306 family)
MRKLATVQQIEEIQPIENADAIEKARIKGWWVVVKKDQFKIGDKCIYFEIDSLLPIIAQFSFLSNGQSLKKSIEDGKEITGFRLKTIRLRNQISQGLIMPLSEFPEVTVLDIDTDVSELLNVFKYEPPIPIHLAGDVKNQFPGFLPKTDEERIQTCPEMLEKYKGCRFYMTSKVDGSSTTIFKHENEFGVCSRNLEMKENETNAYWKMVYRYNLKEKLPNGFAIQAELAGEGVQGNPHKLKGIDIYVFYVFDIIKYQYLKLNDMLMFVQDLGLRTVPIIDDNFILNHTCDEILAMANMNSPLNPNVIQEGIVFRLYDSTEKITFKSISNEYLLKYGN